MSQPNVAELRELAAEHSVEIPADAKKADIEAALTAAGVEIAAVEDGNRREIKHFTNRGDWEDPFSGRIVAFDIDVCPESGARRDGDYAVLEG